MSKKKTKYFDVADLIKAYPQCRYYMVVGQRSNGKSYSALRYLLNEYWKNGSEGAIIRRFANDFKGKNANSFFDGLVLKGEVERITGGEWDSVYYFSGRFYLQKTNEKGEKVRQDRPFCYCFALTQMEHDKSGSYDVRTIVFDEFLASSQGFYLPNEIVVFCNVLSTLIRDRDNSKVIMLANTVNPYNPYAHGMGLYRFKEMVPGDTDIYDYPPVDGKVLHICVHFCDGADKVGGKASDVYFAFSDTCPELNMITGKGTVWELALFPTLPVKYNDENILFRFFIAFDGNVLQCEIVKINGMMFTYIHKKTTPIKDVDRDIIFTTDYDARPNHERYINHPVSKIAKRIGDILGDWQNVYYQDNMIGMTVQNYLHWCEQN